MFITLCALSDEVQFPKSFLLPFLPIHPFLVPNIYGVGPYMKDAKLLAQKKLVVRHRKAKLRVSNHTEASINPPPPTHVWDAFNV